MNFHQAPSLRILSLFIFMFVCSSISAQEITYLNKYRFPIKDLNSYKPEYYNITTYEDEKFIIKMYSMDSVLRSETHTTDPLNNKEQPLYLARYEDNGNLQHLQIIDNDNKVIVKDFYKNGKLRSEKIFVDGEIYKGLYFDEDGLPRSEIVEDHPEPQGGLEGWNNYFSKNLNYPKKARKRGEEGLAILYFVIDEEGRIEDLDIVNPEEISHELAQEALRVINSYPHNWRPAIIDGKPVKVEMRFPLRFKIG